MSIALVYWILMLLWLVLGFAFGPAPFNWRATGPNLLLFILLVLLGWKTFGAPIHG